tara:strand:+ start:7962 stop:8426 length:465 start_codon:yes stop_codon:yes gene_type:complete
MSNSIRTILGLTLVILGVFWNDIRERIPDFTPTPEVVIAIDEPSEKTKEKVSSISSLVTDDNDMINMAIFNKVFSDRLLSYEATNQQVNDIYTLAGKAFFEDTLKGKYEGLSSALTNLMKEELGVEVHELTEEEKINLSEAFSGLAWALQENNK